MNQKKQVTKDAKAILELIGQGLSYRQVGERLGYTKAQVRDFLHKYRIRQQNRDTSPIKFTRTEIITQMPKEYIDEGLKLMPYLDRQDELKPSERAKLYSVFYCNRGLTVSEVEKAVKCHRFFILGYVKMLLLPKAIVDAIDEKRILSSSGICTLAKSFSSSECNALATFLQENPAIKIRACELIRLAEYKQKNNIELDVDTIRAHLKVDKKASK